MQNSVNTQLPHPPATLASKTGGMLAGLFVVGLLAAWPVWRDVVQIGWENPDAGHILLAPLAILFLGWNQRAAVHGPLRLGWIGAATLASVCGAGLVGIMTDTRCLWHAAGLAFPWVCLWSVLPALSQRRLLPALLACGFMVPLPGTIDSWVTTPLTNAQIWLTGKVDTLLGWNLLIEGQTVIVGNVDVHVEKGCAGFRILWPVLIVAWAVCFSQPLSKRNRIILLASVPVFALGLNVMRLMITIALYGVVSPEMAGWAHDLSGLVVLVAAPMVPLALVQATLNRGTITAPTEPVAKPAVVRADWTKWSVAGLALLCLGGLSVPIFWRQAMVRPSADSSADAVQLLQAVPYQFGEWIGEDVPVPPEQLSRLQPDAMLHRQYRHWTTGETLMLMVAYHADGRDHAGHSADACYPATGWTLVASGENYERQGLICQGKQYEFTRKYPVTTQMTVIEYKISSPAPARSGLALSSASPSRHELARIQLLVNEDSRHRLAEIQADMLESLEPFILRITAGPAETAGLAQR
ncbi:MAG: EpsI family protein [Planctomycetes bacterium]|nr:EpsI family protein [Planctomycetota bacterium]